MFILKTRLEHKIEFTLFFFHLDLNHGNEKQINNIGQLDNRNYEFLIETKRENKL